MSQFAYSSPLPFRPTLDRDPSVALKRHSPASLRGSNYRARVLRGKKGQGRSLLENMCAALPTSQWIQLNIGLLDESGCGRKAAKIGWKNASTVVTTPSSACVWLGPDTHSPSSTKMHADPVSDKTQVNIMSRRCHCETNDRQKRCYFFNTRSVNTVRNVRMSRETTKTSFQ